MPNDSIYLQAYGEDDAVIFRPRTAQPFVVARGYDHETGEWDAGSYFSSLTDAVAEASGLGETIYRLERRVAELEAVDAARSGLDDPVIDGALNPWEASEELERDADVSDGRHDCIFVVSLDSVREDEPRVVGGWIQLPVDPSGLADRLTLACGEDGIGGDVAVFDAELNGVLGSLGMSPDDYTDIASLNALAVLASRLDDDEIEAVAACVSARGLHRDPLAVANVALQAMDIPYYPFETERDGNRSPQAILGEAAVEELGGIESVDRDDLVAFADRKSIGERYADAFDIDIAGNLAVEYDESLSGAASDPGRYTNWDELRAAAIAAAGGDALEKRDPADARSSLLKLGIHEPFVTESSDLEAVVTEALLIYEGGRPVPDAVTRAAIVSAEDRADDLMGYAHMGECKGEIAYVELDPTIPDPAEALGAALAEKTLDIDELRASFDYERFGRERGGSLALTDKGFYDYALDDLNTARYGFDEVLAAIAGDRPDLAPEQRPAAQDVDRTQASPGLAEQDIDEVVADATLAAQALNSGQLGQAPPERQER